MEEKPLVSCIFVTYNDLPKTMLVVKSFTEQTYQNKELIIIDSGTHEYHNDVKSIVNTYDKNNKIKLYYFSESHLTVEYLRNWGKQYCRGEHIISFEDDVPEYHIQKWVNFIHSKNNY